MKERNSGENNNAEGRSIKVSVVEMSLMEKMQIKRVVRTRISITRYAFLAWIIIFPICLLNENIPSQGKIKNRPVFVHSQGLSEGSLKLIEKGQKTIDEFSLSNRYKPEEMK